MISVIIPLYNKAHTIVNTLTTVLNQTYQDFEIIIVNDGSTDNSVETINTYFCDSRIHIINQDNAGVSVARNRGVEVSKGDWIAFLDADDEWLPQYLETLLGALNRYPQANMIGCASYYKDFITNKISANALIDKYYGKSVHINYFMNPDKMTHIGATIISKKAFIDVGGFDPQLKNNEDILLLGSIAMYGYFVYVGQCLHVYVGNVKGQTTCSLSKEICIKNSIDILNRFYDLYKKGKVKNKLVPISIKYRARHQFLGLLKSKHYSMLQIAIKQLNPDLKNLLAPTMILLKYNLNKVCIIYIYITKIIWLIHGFPRVGVQSKYNMESINKYMLSHE